MLRVVGRPVQGGQGEEGIFDSDEEEEEEGGDGEAGGQCCAPFLALAGLACAQAVQVFGLAW
jgi:hypothetical protein